MAENTERIQAFKQLNHKGTSESLRQRRHDVTVELRKNKKEDQLFKRRNIQANEEPTSPLQESNSQNECPYEISELVPMMRSSDRIKQFQAVQNIRRMLSKERNPPIDIMIEAGVVPICVSFLAPGNDPELQFEAAWALTNIASGTSDQTNAVMSAQAVPKFVELLMSPSQKVAEQSVWALGNIAGDGPSARDYVLGFPVVENLLKLMHSHIVTSFLRNIVWLCSNLCRNKNPHPPFEKIEPLLPVLCELLKNGDELILTDACWALSYITDDDAEKIQAVVDTGVVPLLVNLLDSPVVAIITPALRTIGNIVTGTDAQTDCVLNAEILPRLANLLTNKKQAIVKEAAWTVSNIAAGNPEQIGKIIASDILKILPNVLATGDFKTQKEAAWIVTNITTGGLQEQIIFLIENCPILKPFCDLLDAHDARTVKVVMNGLENLFRLADKIGGTESLSILVEEIGGLDKLEALQNHQNEEIYKSAYALVSTYFSEEGQSEPGLGPAESNGELQFNPTNGTENDQGGYSF